MAASDTHKLLVQVQADISDINKVVQGLNSIQGAATQISTGSAASIGAFTAAFEGLGEVAKKTGEILIGFIEGFVTQAAKIQEEEFPLTQILRDNGVVAKEVLEGISSLWQEVGVISSESLSRAARSLLLMNVPAENLISRLQDLGKVSVATGEQVDQVAGAYQRVRQAIEKETAPAVRGVGAFGLSTLAIFQALEDHFGKLAGTTRIAEGQLVAMFQGGKVSINDLNVALQEAAASGGRFGDVFEQKKATFNGAIEAMQTAWQGFQTEMGKPFLDWATPIINQITVIARAFTEFATNHSWQDTMKLAWIVLMDEIVLIIESALNKASLKITEALIQGFDAAEKVMKDFFYGGFVTGGVTGPLAAGAKAGAAFSSAFTNEFGTDVSDDLEKQREKLDTAIERLVKQVLGHAGTWVEEGMNEIWNEFLAHPPPMPLPPPTEEETHRADTAKQLAAALHELEAVMNNIKATNELINSAPFMGMDEKRVATIQNIGKEISNLEAQLEKMRALKDQLPFNDPQAAQMAVHIQTAENKVKSLQQQLSGMTKPFQAEFQQWANSFGTTVHQISTTIQQTINASLSSLNQFLVTGKFNAQALLQQIILLGLQLIEQLAIQQVMRMINRSAAITEAETTGPIIAAALAPAVTAQTIATDGAAAIAAPIEVAAAEAGILGILSAHTGGLMRRYFHGGGLAHDEVPIIAQEGEIMIQRSVAQQPGMMDFLLGLNAGEFHGGGFIWGGRYHSGSFNPDYNPDILTVRGGFPLPEHWATDAARAAAIEAAGDTRQGLWLSRMWAGFGTTPSTGLPAFGATMDPTSWHNYPGVGNVPMAVPVTPDVPFRVSQHFRPKARSHDGGMISRMHGGGSVGGGGGGVHIYAFTDLKALTRHMGSKDGQKIIFDTVKGRRIALGIS